MRVEIQIRVEADRSIADETEEMEFDNEGELIVKKKKAKPAEAAAEEAPAETADAAE